MNARCINRGVQLIHVRYAYKCMLGDQKSQNRDGVRLDSSFILQQNKKKKHLSHAFKAGPDSDACETTAVGLLLDRDINPGDGIIIPASAHRTVGRP